MNKAILVLNEIPKSCDECNFLSVLDVDGIQPEKYFCGIQQIGENVEDYVFCRPSFCPLRPMPENKHGYMGADDAYEEGYGYGFNDCLRVIEGSGEDD